ncbi:MAG: IclR family transcriptional regulator C-terminal domain-containing protein [Pseudomonadota bacterium]|nr:IclR family transcriptional regulator C-terminal domain-containing protein [Pseudomonadota bacterium]
MATPLNATVLKAFDLLDLFGPDRREITADNAARDLDMTYATAHRFLVTLESSGILSATRRGVYGPGPRLARLGRMAEALSPLPAGLQSALDGLRRDLGESVMACRYTPRGPLCVAVSQAERPISVNIRTGTTLPMLPSAQGRLFLAYMSAAQRTAWAKSQGQSLDDIAGELDELRRVGCAVNLGDNEPDIAAVSVPVLGADGQVIVTLSVFGMLSRFDAATVDHAKAALLSVADTLGH